MIKYKDDVSNVGGGGGAGRRISKNLKKMRT